MKCKGAYLTLEIIGVLLLISIVIVSSISLGQYFINNSKLENSKIIAKSIDYAIFEYGNSHKTINRESITFNSDNNKLIYNNDREYPLKIGENGIIYNQHGALKESLDLGYLGTEIEWITSNSPDLESDDNLYKFYYTPLDIEGNKITDLADTSVNGYKIEVGVKKGNGKTATYCIERIGSNELSEKLR